MSPESAPKTKACSAHGITSARLAHPDLPSLVESNFNLFLSTTSPTTSSNSSRNARSTPVLVIRPPAQPPLSQEDWEPPSALGVYSPEGFKSEQSISKLRPYTPSPSVSTFAPSSVTSSTVSTPRVDIPARPEVPQVLQKVTEELALHIQRSLESIESESVYSDPGTAPESFESAEQDDKPEPEKTSESIDIPPAPVDIPSEPVEIPSISIDPPSKPVDLSSEQILSDPATESLQVERPLSPVAVNLASSSSTSSSSHDRTEPMRPSLFGFLSRWSDKRSPSAKDYKDRQSDHFGPVPSSDLRHDSTGSSAFARLKNRSTDRLASMGFAGEEIKPSSSSIKSSIFKKSIRRKDSGSAPPVPPIPTSDAHLSVPSTGSETRTVLVADIEFPLDVESVRSGTPIPTAKSPESADTDQSTADADGYSLEEPIGGEPVLISSELQSLSDHGTVSQEPGNAAERTSRDLPTPPRSRSPSVFKQKLGGKRYRTGSLKDLLKRSDTNKNQKLERPPLPTSTIFSWITQHTQRSQYQNNLEIPTPTATPDLTCPPESTTPIEVASPTATDTSRIRSLVWYPPELIRSPYASYTSLDLLRAHHPTTLDDLERSILGVGPISPTSPISPYEQMVIDVSQPGNPYIRSDHNPAIASRLTITSTSTAHSPSSPARKKPAKLRRRHRAATKKSLSRTPPTAYTALARKHSRASGRESSESVAGSSVAGASTGPSQSLDTLLNSAWPEPPLEQSSQDEGRQGQGYNYLSETGAEDDSDQEEYLPSPTSAGASTRPTTPKNARARSRSPGDALREQRVLPPVMHDAQGEQPDWEPNSRVTSYVTASPSIRSPASPFVVSQPVPVPPLPVPGTPRIRQNTGSTTRTRPSGIVGALPAGSALASSQFASVAPAPPPKSLSATPSARKSVRSVSPSRARASPIPRTESPSLIPRPVATAPILRTPSLPRRTTSYQSASSLQLPTHRNSLEGRRSARPSLDERRGSLEDSRSEDRRSTSSPNHMKRRSPTQAQKEPHSPTKRDSSQYRRSRRDSGRSGKDSLRSHRDSITLRKDTIQTQRRTSIHSRRDSQRPNSGNSHRDQIASENQIWAVPRSYNQRPTISFEFPPSNEFWHFLNEYQKFSSSGAVNGEDSGNGPSKMSERRSGSAASGSTTRTDPVKDWHKTQTSSSRTSGDRAGSPYVPTAEVIERNELIIKALKNAPGALETRFRHFGQLGVLGWSSEFSELVDEIQRCGLERQMFTNTREQALATCKALLRLHIEIRLQMISMFLCSQIARLRRFLDAETEYTDYPTPNFPLPDTY